MSENRVKMDKVGLKRGRADLGGGDNDSGSDNENEIDNNNDIDDGNDNYNYDDDNGDDDGHVDDRNRERERDFTVKGDKRLRKTCTTVTVAASEDFGELLELLELINNGDGANYTEENLRLCKKYVELLEASFNCAFRCKERKLTPENVSYIMTHVWLKCISALPDRHDQPEIIMDQAIAGIRCDENPKLPFSMYVLPRECVPLLNGILKISKDTAESLRAYSKILEFVGEESNSQLCRNQIGEYMGKMLSNIKLSIVESLPINFAMRVSEAGLNEKKSGFPLMEHVKHNIMAQILVEIVNWLTAIVNAPGSKNGVHLPFPATDYYNLTQSLRASGSASSVPEEVREPVVTVMTNFGKLDVCVSEQPPVKKRYLQNIIHRIRKFVNDNCPVYWFPDKNQMGDKRSVSMTRFKNMTLQLEPLMMMVIYAMRKCNEVSPPTPQRLEVHERFFDRVFDRLACSSIPDNAVMLDSIWNRVAVDRQAPRTRNENSDDNEKTKNTKPPHISVINQFHVLTHEEVDALMASTEPNRDEILIASKLYRYTCFILAAYLGTILDPHYQNDNKSKKS